MDDAIKVGIFKDLAQRCLIANVSFEQTVSWVFLVSTYVLALYFGLIEIIKIINDGYVPIAIIEEMVHEM